MTHIHLTVHEGVAPQDDVSGGGLESDATDVHYEVLKPLFKRGRTWEPGEVIQLERSAALRFLDQGEIKEMT